MKKMLVVCSTLCAVALPAIAGNKPAGAARNVTGAFMTVYFPDDGSSTSLSTPPPFGQMPTNLLVPDDSPTRYTGCASASSPPWNRLASNRLS